MTSAGRIDGQHHEILHISCPTVVLQPDLHRSYVRALRSFQEINVKVNNYIHSLHAEAREPYCEQTPSLKANVENRFSNVINLSHAYIFCAEKLFKDNKHNTSTEYLFCIFTIIIVLFAKSKNNI